MKPHLLIVDDDLALQALFRMILGRNFEVSEAVCGEEAVTLALSSVPDLILLDIMLPDIDGFEVCRRLKADRRTGSIPVILVSARVDALSLAEAQHLPVADVIRKPFVPRDLVQCVNRVLQHSAVRRDTGQLQSSVAAV